MYLDQIHIRVESDYHWLFLMFESTPKNHIPETPKSSKYIENNCLTINILCRCRGAIRGKAAKHLPQANFEVITVILYLCLAKRDYKEGLKNFQGYLDYEQNISKILIIEFLRNYRENFAKL